MEKEVAPNAPFRYQSRKPEGQTLHLWQATVSVSLDPQESADLLLPKISKGSCSLSRPLTMRTEAEPDMRVNSEITCGS